MKISEALRRMLLTRKCLICDEVIDYERENPICDDCEEAWDEYLEARCNKCGGDRYTCSCMPMLVKKNFNIVSWSVFYNKENKDAANSIIFMLKYWRHREAIMFCTKTMKNMLLDVCKKHNINYKEFAVTYSPRRKVSIRKHLFDHAREMAKYLAELLEIEFVDALENTGKKEQKKLSAIERRRNAQKSYKLKKNFVNKHKKYFLVDDIMTTGSTLVYCSRLLFDAGASEVIPVTYAKDNYKIKGDY